MIDSHCHLDDYEDLTAILANAHNAKVGLVLAIGIGDGPGTMGKALELAKRFAGKRGPFPRIYASAGIHPQEAHQATSESIEKLSILADDPLCIAIGEIGLDYYHVDNPEVEIQKAAFIAQMKIAAGLKKPIVIHCRTSELATPSAKAKFGLCDAWEDLLALLDEHWAPTGLMGIMHCFSGNEDQAKRSIESGFYLSFAGNLTYPRSSDIRNVAASAPANRILVETDAPFLAPVPFRGQRNEPALVVHTARFLAELRGITLDELAELTTANFGALFRSAMSGTLCI